MSSWPAIVGRPSLRNSGGPLARLPGVLRPEERKGLMKSPRRFTGVAIAALATGLLLGPSPASAAAPDRFTEPIDSTFMADDFCDIDGLTVEIVRSGQETVQVMKRGSDSPAYFSAHVTVESVFTNAATGAFFTTREVSRFKDLYVTDNGDGTLTAVNFGTGFAMMFDPDGRIIGKDTGQTRWESIIDLNGTPDDFDDDELISEEVLLGSTGTNDDFCEVAVGALTG
jgi:hypothetical protein